MSHPARRGGEPYLAAAELGTNYKSGCTGTAKSLALDERLDQPPSPHTKHTRVSSLFAHPLELRLSDIVHVFQHSEQLEASARHVAVHPVLVDRAEVPQKHVRRNICCAGSALPAPCSIVCNRRRQIERSLASRMALWRNVGACTYIV